MGVVLPTCWACVAFVACTTLLMYALRAIYRRLLPSKYHAYAAETLSTFQLVVGVLESDIVLEAYGAVGYAFYLFCLFISFTLTFDGTASVCSVWEEMLSGKSDVVKGHIKIACQLLGGLLAPIYVKQFWKMAMSETHLSKSQFLDLQCESALKVPIIPGMFAEMMATLISTLVCNFHIGGDRLSMYIEHLTSVTIIIIGMEYTGMMFNPALATSLTYNCLNHSMVEHLLVYWFGPFLAVVLIWMLTKPSTVDVAKKTA
ncbi:aquaporin-11-like [Saccoglossus kowalevskii]|uniref:Aquaporin-11-like n=1 Tax=Saccoglossus kowalevskii TaxID=10224 RepID=A0ABM0GX54_SACKO|nr:PREDICTED: aquaporin-11-like [Saccoglossus kowalevskii]